MSNSGSGVQAARQAQSYRAANERKDSSEKKQEVRTSNILAAKQVSDIIRTSLGPRGMDKMIVEPTGDVVLSNDGATIMSRIMVTHPCAKMLVELSKAQDIEAGDGTTSVVVLAGAFLRAVESLLGRGVHPTHIAEAFQMACTHAAKVLESIAVPVELSDRETLIRAAVTSLASKFVASQSAQLAPLAVDAVTSIFQPVGKAAENTDAAADAKASATAEAAATAAAVAGAAGESVGTRDRPVVLGPDGGPIVDLNRIRVVQAMGGTVDDTELVDGLVFKLRASRPLGFTGRFTNAKVGLVQFQLSPPKTDMESEVVVSDYHQIDRALQEEKRYLLNICRAIKSAGCDVLLVQKSILRDAVTDLSEEYLKKLKIMLIKDVERDDVPFICQTLGITPVAHVDNFTAEKLGVVSLVSDTPYGDGRLVKMSGCAGSGTKTVLLRGSSQLVLDEAERSLHDALCVVRCLLRRPFMLAGGASPEVELSLRLAEYAETLDGYHQLCVRAYADAFETIPYTLAENAGLRAMGIVTELRSRHRAGHPHDGVNMRKGCVSDMRVENVLQPLLVTLSAVKLATELTMTILKIDDIVTTR
eukprot:TRINITY_DN1420_c0_g1_i1.p1 TRINITY_DN1420_c0_g1~~TRINITY_DN1420_c0_g1_i1.p1  ORF type:complete len:588 (+),score=182.17 TRINITY_DN1420_c0_g1_i1:102-1865(+)